MENKAFGIADVGQMREELDVIDDFYSCLITAFYTKNNYTAKAVFQIF